MKFALILAALIASGAGAAELPTKLRDVMPEPPKARTCEIDRERGYALPGGGCVRVGVSARNVKH